MQHCLHLNVVGVLNSNVYFGLFHLFKIKMMLLICSSTPNWGIGTWEKKQSNKGEFYFQLSSQLID